MLVTVLAFRRRSRRALVTAPALATVDVAASEAADPFQRALERLAEIEGAGWAATGDLARHYTAVADALRDYLAAAEGIPARERTSTEVLRALPPHLSAGALRRGCAALLGEADLVKFARGRPDASAAVVLVGDARACSWDGARRRRGGRSPMRFADPLYLLLLLVPGAWAWTQWRERRRAPVERIGFPGLVFLAGAPTTRRARWPWVPDALRMLGLALLVVALARPQVPHEVRQIRSKSRNIMLALDISSSMKAGDFKPGNRLMVARKVLADFTRERKGDLLGLVIFAGRAFLQAPLTPDTELLDRMLGRVDIGMLPDGTAIGTALAMSLNQLKDLPATASVIVLITDGANNTGQPSPLVAAEAARAIGVRIHTIGVSAADTSGPDKRFIWRWGGRRPTASPAATR